METKNEFQEAHTRAINNTTGEMDYVIDCFDFLLDVQVTEFEAAFNRKVTSDELLKIKLITSNLTGALMQSNLQDTFLKFEDRFKEFSVRDFSY